MSETALKSAPPHLPTYVRFRDLQQAGIVNSWEQLSNLIEDYDFPPGILLSPKARAWDIEDIQRWLARRPIASFERTAA
jgi:predicted DNA-binding transcriptional regulator AlpA